MQLRFDEALRLIHQQEAEFILVGGIAAILQGSPLTTEDVHLVYQVSEENCRRLAKALTELDATYADPAGRKIRPDPEKLRSVKVNLLNTRCGRVDLMQTAPRISISFPSYARSWQRFADEKKPDARSLPFRRGPAHQVVNAVGVDVLEAEALVEA